MNLSTTHLVILAVVIALVIGSGWLFRRLMRRPASEEVMARRQQRVRSALALVAILAVVGMVRDFIAPAKPDAAAMVTVYLQGKSFPVRVNDTMRLDSVEGQGNMVVFNYTVDAQGRTTAEVSQWLQGRHDAQMQAACAKPELRAMLDQGLAVDFAYRYQDELADNVYFSANTCQHA